ncbi:ER lumen protein retaining receptor [Penicillium robsamsonii]|uniref:ER lumen protein retaining receptor n=1 Tax=Penicillium robsamsonii TaxID=1792511 RepID=UPI002547C192|nr:ER lumen protein retaining receptor [Penicillium robsamsonii]KAJ5834721.1 ER lumen protein retaining receptor [Penicillium robsamsonii]
MSTWNIFRIIGDLSHLGSICVLLWAIHKNKSAEGISLLTQLLYGVVFIFRYLDLLLPITYRVRTWHAIWNVFFKLFYITSSAYLITLMMKVYPRTRETERAWKLGLWSVAGSVVLAPISIWLFEKEVYILWILEFFWAFSIILESVCVLPQLLLLRQTTVPTVIDSYYLLALGSYRAFYILNWIVRLFDNEPFDDWIAVVFGIVQTAFYIDFAWVYYSRQRVKLRNGGIVDSEDYENSWLVNRVVNFRTSRRSADEEQHLRDEEEGVDGQSNHNRWGARGVSIAADDTLETNGHSKGPHHDDSLDGFSGDEDDTDDHRVNNSR